MNAYTFSIACLCGAPVEHVAGSGEASTRRVVVCRCTHCHRHWTVEVLMRPAPIGASGTRRLTGAMS